MGFDLFRLRKGESINDVTGAQAVILVMIEGKAIFHAADQDWGELGARMNMFEKTPPHSFYLPNDRTWEAPATTDCTLAVCKAPEKSGHGARRIGPNGIALTEFQDVAHEG